MESIIMTWHLHHDFPRSKLAGLIGLFLLGCSPSDSHQRDGLEEMTIKPISIERFADSPKIQDRVFQIPFANMAKSLGSLRFQAESRYRFSRDENEIEKIDRFEIRSDSKSNSYFLSDSETGNIEAYRVDGEFFIRHDLGPLRKTPKESIDSKTWAQLSLESQAEILSIVLPFIRFEERGIKTVSGRVGMEFALTLHQGDQEKENSRSGTQHPSSVQSNAGAAWRTRAKPKAIEGTIVLDQEFSFPIAIDLHARFEIQDREINPTQLRLDYSSTIDQIRKVAAVKTPKHRQGI